MVHSNCGQSCVDVSGTRVRGVLGTKRSGDLLQGIRYSEAVDLSRVSHVGQSWLLNDQAMYIAQKENVFAYCSKRIQGAWERVWNGGEGVHNAGLSRYIYEG